MTASLNYQTSIPDVIQALGQVHHAMDRHGLEPLLRHLVQLRASQLNQCHYCISLHTREAREDGEQDERLASLSEWRQSPHFTDRERAALAWTEALTQLKPGTELSHLRDELRTQFDETTLCVLTTTVAMINLWNRVQIARH